MVSEQELKSKVEAIAGHQVEWDENLFEGSLDSLSLVEIVNLVEQLSKRSRASVNIDAMISDEKLTLRIIYQALGGRPCET